MQAKKVSEQVRRRLAGNTRSDHLVLLRAYEEWEAARQVHTRPIRLIYWPDELVSSVSDPYSFATDTDPDPILVHGFDDQKLKKICS